MVPKTAKDRLGNHRHGQAAAIFRLEVDPVFDATTARLTVPPKDEGKRSRQGDVEQAAVFAVRAVKEAGGHVASEPSLLDLVEGGGQAQTRRAGIDWAVQHKTLIVEANGRSKSYRLGPNASVDN